MARRRYCSSASGACGLCSPSPFPHLLQASGDSIPLPPDLRAPIPTPESVPEPAKAVVKHIGPVRPAGRWARKDWGAARHKLALVERTPPPPSSSGGTGTAAPWNGARARRGSTGRGGHEAFASPTPGSGAAAATRGSPASTASVVSSDSYVSIDSDVYSPVSGRRVVARTVDVSGSGVVRVNVA